MIPREKYIQKIRPHMHHPVIKVLTGIRRSGKSALLTLIIEELKSQGIKDDHIIRINFEESRFFSLTNALLLDEYLRERMNENEKYFILLDEIQEVENWEKTVNSLLAAGNADIYLTGSNSRLLSSELSTYLAGRYVEIPIQTLTFFESLVFAEHLSAMQTDYKAAFISYLKKGGFPILHAVPYDEEAGRTVVSGIYASVILRDVIQRYNLRNTELFERLVLFLFENTGNIFSAKSVSDFLKSQNRQLSVNTIYEYLRMLEEAFVIHRVSRYDMAGKRVLKTLEKYYVSDISLISAALGFRDTKISGMLENIVYLELISRDYHVYIGKSGEREIDFVAEKNGERIYIQVARAILSDETREREFAPLLAVHNHYPKYVVTMDELAGGTVDGIRHVHIADFLLMDSW
ncbi:MAG: ATP-binding protein [Methanocorpusculum parvum]|nr:ATP-binding protein [Methanocorpusculum parvum]